MDHDRCGPGVRWCARADAMFNVDGMHVLDVRLGHRKLVITVETDTDAAGCRRCGVVATGHGRRRVSAADAPCFGMAVEVSWLKRVWRCAEPDCAIGTWSEMHDLIAPRTVLTGRAVGWATDALAHDDTTIGAGAASAGRLAHPVAGGESRGDPADDPARSPARGAHARGGRAHLETESPRPVRSCDHRDGGPDPRGTRTPARTAAGRGARPLGHRLRRLAAAAIARVHRRYRARRARPVSRLRQRDPRRAA